jgi:RND family efflux transporter MFP subunit
MVREGDPLFDLVVEDPLRLWANVPERFSGQVREGQPVRISVASHPDRTFEGKVSRVNPSVDPVSRTFQVEALAPNAERLLRPGGFAKAVIVTASESDAITVPLESIVQYAGVTKLFVVEGDEVRAVDDLELGKEGSGWVEVSSAAMPDSGSVVTTGHSKLAGGSRIVVRDAEAEAAAESKADAAEPEGSKPVAAE